MNFYLLNSKMEKLSVSEETYRFEEKRQKDMYGGSTMLMVDESIGGGICLLPYKDIRQAVIDYGHPIKIDVAGVSKIPVNALYAKLKTL